MKKTLTLASMGLVAAATLWSAPASACRCMMMPASALPARATAALASSEAVFTGQVRWSALGVYLFRATSIFKGDVDKYVRVTNTSSAACGYTFQEGQTYLLFTGPKVAGAYPNPGTCSGIILPVAKAANLLPLLGNGRPPAGERIPDEFDQPCRPPMSRLPEGQPGAGTCGLPRVIKPVLIKAVPLKR